jgi:glycosyltransferase involved in cell wall biosynthesis/O-antigen/teichoic acid export membrane protein
VSTSTSPVGFRRGLLFTSTASIVNLVLLALETVVAARLLPVAVYGSYILLLTTVQFLMMALDFGCKSSVTQMISSGDRARHQAVVGSALIFRIVVLVAASVLLWLFRGLLAIIDPSPDLAKYVAYIPLMLATASLDELLSAMLQGFHAYRPMTIAQVSRGIFRIILTVVLLVAFHSGVEALVESWSISFAVAVAYQYWALPTRKLWKGNWSTLWEMLRFGSSLQVTRFLGFASARLHITLLAALAGVNSVAYFAAASRIPDALQTLTDSYFRVYFPTMTTLLAEGRQKAAQVMFDRTLRLMSFTGALAAVCGAVFSHEIMNILFTSKFGVAAPAFALLMISLYMTVVVNVLGYTLTAGGRPQSSLVVTLVRTAVSAAGDLLLIPSAGVVGSAWAAVAGSFASNPPGALLVRSSHLRVDVAAYVKQTAILALCVALGLWIQTDALIVTLSIKVAIVALFMVLSFILSTTSFGDLALIVGDRGRRPSRQIATSIAPNGILIKHERSTVHKKRICIIGYKSVRITIHLLRQINYLAPKYDLTVIGHGEPGPEWPPLTFQAVQKQTRASQLFKLFWFALARVIPFVYDAWFWNIARHKLAYKYAVESGADAFHANDWEALPIAVEAAKRVGGRVVFHMHEYAEEEGSGFLWRLLVGPAIRYFTRKYVADPDVPIAASVTVCEPIAQRYHQEIGLQPIVVYNAPRPVAVPPRAENSDPGSIRLIHHGFAKRGRGLHTLIEALALTDPRFTLDFMLMEDDPGYIDELKRLADRLAPGRVHFRNPVRPAEIVATVAQYDLGFCVIAPSCYNQLMMLPNKLFEYIQAGLAVCVGPSPAMADLVGRYNVGLVTPSFSPSEVAATLNRLTDPDLRKMQHAARQAAAVLNADVEMAKIVGLYHGLLGGDVEPAALTDASRVEPLENGALRRFARKLDWQVTTIAKTRICIIAFKPVRTTIHSLRLINYLAPNHDLTVIGHGEPGPEWPSLTWKAVPPILPTVTSRASKLLGCALGRFTPSAYEAWYWSIERNKLAYKFAIESGAEAFHAINWDSLPIAIEAARRTGGRVVFDMREYAEEERANSLLWRLLIEPSIRYFTRKYVADPDVPIAASVTVCEPIAQRYHQEIGLQPIVVYNAPRPVAVPPRAENSDPGSIRLIHHGFAQRGRGLHTLIEALALTDPRFTLDFMLMEGDPGYIDELKRLADRLAPGRVHFRNPVRPAEIVATVAQYDLGFCVIAPSCYNQLMMLPNKLFEYIQAGLAVCVGPSPAMADLVGRYNVGLVTPSFSPSEVAATLNRLTDPDLRKMQHAARQAAAVLNADVEMAKIVGLYHELLGEWRVAGSTPEPRIQRRSPRATMVRNSRPCPDEGALSGHQRRACVVVQSTFPADVRVRREAEALLSDGWLLDVICLQGPGEPLEETWGQASIHRLPGARRRGTSLMVYFLEYLTFFALAASHVTKLSLRHRYDLVHTHNLPDFLVFTAILPRLLGARLVLDIHDPTPDLFVSKFGENTLHPVVKVTRWIEAASSAFADLVLTPGEPSRQRLVGRNVPPEKIANVLNSADPRLFSPPCQAHPRATPDSSFTLVYHGSFFERYGLDIAIEAVHRLRDEIPGLRFRIAGGGETADDLKRLVAKLGLEDRVTFAGQISVDKIADFVAGSDLGVVPYRQDTFTDLVYPTKTFEYIAMGVPVVMSGLAGVVELFPNIPDLFFRPNDVDDLARHILRLYREPERLGRLNDALRNAYIPYSWEGQRQKYLGLVDQLVNSPGRLVVSSPVSNNTN